MLARKGEPSSRGHGEWHQAEAVGLGGGSRVEIELDPYFRELWDREKSQGSVTTHPRCLPELGGLNQGLEVLRARR